MTKKDDKKPAETQQDDKSKVEVIDFTKPVHVVFDQTASRNNFKLIQGDKDGKTAQERALSIASGIAMNSGRTCAVFGPQMAVKAPPKEPQAEDVKLDF